MWLFFSNHIHFPECQHVRQRIRFYQGCVFDKEYRTSREGQMSRGTCEGVIIMTVYGTEAGMREDRTLRGRGKVKRQISELEVLEGGKRLTELGYSREMEKLELVVRECDVQSLDYGAFAFIDCGKCRVRQAHGD